MALEQWQRDILDNQIAQETRYASDKPLCGFDAACSESYRSKHSQPEMARRLRWLSASYDNPSLPLHAVK
jgi:hypothetical protein